jgi:hypothetical protein
MEPYYIGKQSHLLTGLRWTTDPPTVGGWYWLYFKSAGTPLHCLFVQLDQWGDPWVDSDDIWAFENVTHWLGPIPTPEPPQ